MSGVLLDVVGPYFASHRGVADRSLSTPHVIHQLSVDRGIESHLTKIQFHFDVIGGQTERYGTVISLGPQSRWVEVHLDPDRYVGYQQFAVMKDFEVWHEA